MKMHRIKLFWKIGDAEKKVYAIDYDADQEYSTFLHKCNVSGYRQIIISSEVMVLLLKKSVINDGFQVYRIEFQQEDDQLQEEINGILDQLPTKPLLFGELLERLKCMTERSSIDIKNIYIKGRNDNGIAVNYYVQSNGIIGINNEVFENISEEISSLVAGGLFYE